MYLPFEMNMKGKKKPYKLRKKYYFLDWHQMLEILKVTVPKDQPGLNGAAAFLHLISNSRCWNVMFVTHCSEEMHKHRILWLLTVELNRLKPLEGRTLLSLTCDKGRFGCFHCYWFFPVVLLWLATGSWEFKRDK